MHSSPSTLRLFVAFVGTLIVAQSLGPKSAFAEPIVLTVEGQAALALTAPQSSWFGPGGALAVAAHVPLSPLLFIGLRLRAGLLSNGDPPQVVGVRDPGWGSFELAALNLRLRPFARGTDARLGTGLFIDLAAGGGVTGKSARPSLEAGIGIGFGLHALTIAPTVRYLQVIQPSNPPSDEDARLLLAGIEVTFNERRPPPPAAPLRPQVVEAEMPDRDHDGIDDAADSCPDTAEDLDGFEDHDGCPELDNDKDGIADANDHCPNDAEDLDGFQDEDGCPERDNDDDGILDENDRCPNAAEIVNGNDDLDGCPDEGQIVFKNDRIVLEERVLFDFEFARVRHYAWPILQAIVKLYRQHPEWGLIQIEGHCDARGNASLNAQLSERRARNVMRKLIDFGMPESVMSYAGFGATRLRDFGTSEEAHQRNRRVEFVVQTRVPLPAAGDSPPTAATQMPPSAASDATGEPAPSSRSLLTPQSSSETD
jgi:outer membrane protein OmpA-like peptidoglycan-associated protein